MTPLENKILAHRYLYYVKGVSLISDYQYDMLEAQLRLEQPDSPIHNQVGSSIDRDYSPEAVDLAMEFVNDYVWLTGCNDPTAF